LALSLDRAALVFGYAENSRAFGLPRSRQPIRERQGRG
jgi:hypothetical protein